MEGFTAESDEAHDRALEYARKGVRINPASHSNFLALGMVYIANGKTDQAVQAIERGIELNPTALCLQGKPDEAIARVSEAARTNPGLRLERRAETAMFHFVARRYTESVEAVQGLDDPPASAVMFHAAALAQLGREDEAKKMIADFRRQAPASASLPYAHYLRGFKYDEDREHYGDALRKAGLEGDTG